MVLKGDPLAKFAAIQREQDKRAQDALRCYRPVKQLGFHLSKARELILSGGKRSGKTTGVAVEFASRVLGTPVIHPEGHEIPLKHPVSTKSDPKLYWVVGWDIDHIGQTIYEKLFSPGLFRVIKDLKTNEWRTYNPARKEDSSRYQDSVPAGALIPERCIDTSQGVNGFVWENAGARNFSSVYLRNGAVIRAFPSSARHAKQGDAVAGIWIDEDIQFPSHLKEWQDRLTDCNGWFLWSVWPHTRNDALIGLIDRAAECKEEEDPLIQHFQLIMSENPFIPSENKRAALARMDSDEEIARRDRGDLLLDTLNMYDFVPGVHLIKTTDHTKVKEKPKTVQDYLMKLWFQAGRFPHEWTRYLAIDPSHTRTAALFGVVPPHEWDGIEFGHLLIVENELVVTKCSAANLADMVAGLISNVNYEAFIMDRRIGRQTRVGTDVTVFQIYSEAFRKAGLSSRQTQSNFIPGCDVPGERFAAVRDLMSISSTGQPHLLLVESKTVETQREFSTYRKKELQITGAETILDEPANPRKHDCMQALEYLCTNVTERFRINMAYVDPSLNSRGGSPAYRRAMSILKKHRDKEENYVHLGPGALAAL